MSSPAHHPGDRQVGVGEIPVVLFIRGFFFLALMSGVVGGMHYYLGLRLIRGAHVSEPWASAAWATLWLGFALIPTSFVLGRVLPRRLAVNAQWVAFLWMGAFGTTLSVTAASDVVLWGAAWAATRTEQWSQLQALVVFGIALPGLVVGFRVARAPPKVVRVTVTVKGLGQGLDGFRIVQLSDTHIGETLGRAFLERVVAQVNALEPDLVALTGDAIDGSVKALRAEVEPFSRLRSKHGNFFVTGNHEHYHGASGWEAELGRLGFTVLHNEHRVIERDGARLVVAGVPDLEGARFSQAHRPDADAAFAGAPAGVPRVLLAHQPRFARQVTGHGVALQLSGHTHGGQMFPFMFLVRLQQPVIAGLRTLWGVPVYTSRGTGYWGPPFRIGTTSEITELTLRAE